jgi:hypothetical protein
LLYIAMPIVGGLIAASGLIVSKVPNAKDALNKILPYKGAIGAAMLGAFVINMIDAGFNPFAGFSLSLLFGIMLLSVLATQLLLGFTMGFGLIAKWIPGESNAEEKAADIQKKLMPFEALLGIIAIASGVLALLYVLSPDIFAPK